MTLGLYETRRRRQRERRLRVFRVVLVLAVIGAVAYWSYQVGLRSADREVLSLTAEVELLETRISELEEDISSLRTEAAAAEQAAAEWERRYATEVPEGVARELFLILRKKLEEGVRRERLEFVLQAVKNERDCGQPETKRFVVRTRLSGNTNDAITFGDGAVTITAAGDTATDSGGNPEAWYDINKPVTVAFTQLGGEAQEVTGVLPLHHSVIVEGREFRFTLVSGARSYLEVTADSCLFP